MKIQRIIIGLVVLFSVAGLTLASISAAPEGVRIQSSDLPAGCQSLQISSGNKVIFRTYAIGVQIYRWNGTAWDFVAPEANLYADANYRGKVGTHYGGPTWESNSGSNVVAARLTDCTPDPTAIPWLLLQSVSTEGPGIFSPVSHIQRVNTTGGLRPTVPGSSIGEEKRVPYTAEYYFYSAEDPE